MKRKILCLSAVLWTASLFVLNISAQDQSNPYQGYLIWEDVVYPSQVAAYEIMTRQQLSLYASQKFSHKIDVFSTNDFTYYWVMRIDNYAAIDTLYMDFNSIYKNVPEEVDAITDGYAGTHESTRSWTCYSDRDLSFRPAGQSGAGASSPYMFMGFCYPQKGKMDEARNAINGFVMLAREKQAKMGWETYIGDLGVEGPMFFWVSFAKDPIEFQTLNSADFDIMGAKSDELWNELTSVMRKYEEKTGWYRKDLSYDPDQLDR
jgi:hypothetical protein